MPCSHFACLPKSKSGLMRLPKKQGVTKSYYAREAILRAYRRLLRTSTSPSAALPQGYTGHSRRIGTEAGGRRALTVPMWRVEFDPDTARELRKLGHEARRNVQEYLRKRIATNQDPRRFGHALLGDFKGLWRYRVGDHCIVVDIRDEEILLMVVTVGHRRNVYDLILHPHPQQIRQRLRDQIVLRASCPSFANICRRAVSRSNSISRCAASRTKLRAQPTAARRSPRVTGET